MCPVHTSLTFVYDYGQLFLYDAGREWSRDAREYVDAHEAAARAGLTVGTSSGVVAVLMPRRENFGARLDVAVEAGPTQVAAGSDHVVEFGLELPSGRVVLEGSGGSGREEVAVPPGRYRARLSGRGFAAAAGRSYDDPGDPGDAYRLELWPAASPAAPEELRRWDGYDSLR